MLLRLKERQVMQKIASVLLALTTMTLVACSGSSSNDDGGSGQSGGLTLAASAYSVAPGGIVTITVSGGTGTYSSLAQVTAGTATQTSTNTYQYTAPNPYAAASATVTITDSGGNSGVLTLFLSSTGGGTLAPTATPSSLSLGGTSLLAVTGGTAPYMWTITSGTGTLSATTGATVGFTASSSISGSVVVRVSDGSGLSGSVTISVGSATTSGMSCGGTYDINVSGLVGTLYIVHSTSGNVGGYVSFVSYPYTYYYPVIGTCTATSGGTGTLNMTQLIDATHQPQFTATVTGSLGGQLSLTGTVLADGATYSWTGTSQGASSMLSAPALSCQGNYNATIAGNPGQMTFVQDGLGAMGGYLLLQGGYYAFTGSCTGTGVTLVNKVNASQYTGTVTPNGSSVSMQGNFITSQGQSNTWSATPR